MLTRFSGGVSCLWRRALGIRGHEVKAVELYLRTVHVLEDNYSGIYRNPILVIPLHTLAPAPGGLKSRGLLLVDVRVPSWFDPMGRVPDGFIDWRSWRTTGH